MEAESQFGQRFQSQLSKLSVNSKPIINSLTMIADDYGDRFHAVVVRCVMERVLAPVCVQGRNEYLLWEENSQGAL